MLEKNACEINFVPEIPPVQNQSVKEKKIEEKIRMVAVFQTGIKCTFSCLFSSWCLCMKYWSLSCCLNSWCFSCRWRSSSSHMAASRADCKPTDKDKSWIDAKKSGSASFWLSYKTECKTKEVRFSCRSRPAVAKDPKRSECFCPPTSMSSLGVENFAALLTICSWIVSCLRAATAPCDWVQPVFLWRVTCTTSATWSQVLGPGRAVLIANRLR